MKLPGKKRKNSRRKVRSLIPQSRDQILLDKIYVCKELIDSYINNGKFVLAMRETEILYELLNTLNELNLYEN